MAGKVIAITGANGGLGRALAARFASDGEKVVMLGRSLDKVQAVAAQLPGDVLALACDLGKPETIRAAFAAIGERHGRLDVLINNAASFAMYHLQDASDDDLIDGINSNLVGAILCTRHAIPLMGRGSQLIHVTSESVIERHPMLSMYEAGKAGTERFSRSMDEELAPLGIRSTIFRAAQMHGEGMSATMDTQAAERFFQECVERGLDPTKRGFSSYASVARVIRNIVDLPADVTLDIVSCHGVIGQPPLTD